MANGIIRRLTANDVGAAYQASTTLGKNQTADLEFYGVCIAVSDRGACWLFSDVTSRPVTAIAGGDGSISVSRNGYNHMTFTQTGAGYGTSIMVISDYSVRFS